MRRARSTGRSPFSTFSTPTPRSRESPRLSRAVRVRRRHGRSWATPNPCSRWEGSGQTAASSPCPSPRFKRRTRQPARRYGGARRRENLKTRARRSGSAARSGAVVALASTRDGARLVSVGLDDTARVFFADSGTSVSVGVLPGSRWDVAIAADRRPRRPPRAARCSGGVSEATPKRIFRTCTRSSSPVIKSAVRLRLCGRRLRVFGRADGAVRALRVSDAPDGRTSLLEDDERKSFTRHRAEIVRLACSPTRPWVVASADASRRIFVHDLGVEGGDADAREPRAADVPRRAYHRAGLVPGREEARLRVPGRVRHRVGPLEQRRGEITVKNAHPGGVTSLVWRDDARVCTGVSTRACGRGRCDDDETRGTIDRSIDRSMT